MQRNDEQLHQPKRVKFQQGTYDKKPIDLPVNKQMFRDCATSMTSDDIGHRLYSISSPIPFYFMSLASFISHIYVMSFIFQFVRV